MESGPKPPPIPLGLMRVLRRAREDAQFLEQLVQRRSAAADEAGEPLSGNEKATLDAVPEAQLRAMVASLPVAPAPPRIERPEHDVPAPGGCAADVPAPPRPGLLERVFGKKKGTP